MDRKENPPVIDQDVEARPPSTCSSVHEKSHHPLGERPECFKSTFQEVSFVFMATIGMASNSFLAGATSTVTAFIGADLGMTQSQITWISAASALVSGSFQLALGQLSDLLGRRAMFITGMAAFSAGCLLTAFAQNPFWMDIMSGVLGLLSSLIVPPAVGILGAAYSTPSKRKNFAFACFSAGNPLGFAIGSIATGVASRIFDWRAAFIFFSIMWAVFTALLFWIVPKGVECFGDSPLTDRLRSLSEKFDYVGMILTIVGVGMFTAALTLGPADGWKAAHVIAMLVVGFTLMVLFIVWEGYHPNPQMPLRVWKDRNFALIVIAAVFGVVSFNSSNFWLALLMQRVRHYDPLGVAVHLLPQVIAGIIWNVVIANLMHRVNNTLLMGIGALGYLSANLLLSFQELHTSYWALAFPSLLLNVLGADFQFNIATMYVMQSLPSQNQSLAGSIFIMLQRLGSTMGLGISTAVYTSVSTKQGLSGSVIYPYRMAFFTSVAFAGFSCLFVPFMRLNTQGQSPKPGPPQEDLLTVPAAATGQDDVMMPAIRVSSRGQANELDQENGHL